MKLHEILQQQFPQGSQGGECGVFAHRLIDFPNVGDSYSQKKKSVQANGILNGFGPGTVDSDFRLGDVLITSEGTFMGIGNGHVAVVNKVSNIDYLQLTESNFKKDGKITHTRAIRKDSPKIYGVLRGPYKFKLPEPKYPIVLKTTIFMQYEKQWDSKIFGELADWFFKASGGRIQLDIYPLYTYGVLKNWSYSAYGVAFGDFYNVISKDYFDQFAMPLRFPGSHIVLWSVNKQQWQGSVFNRPDLAEIGWYYPQSYPLQAVMACEEGDMSPANPDVSLFFDAARHEIAHGLYYHARWDQKDLCHQRFFGVNGYPKDFDKIFDDFDYSLLNLKIN